LFEIAIKQKIGKLPDFQGDIAAIYRQALSDNFTFLPISNTHISAYATIPLFAQHRDPFDRLLIATAYEEAATLITIDSNFSLYSKLIELFW
jgi:PIN domain nuclease of toxin-antitoxin system